MEKDRTLLLMLMSGFFLFIILILFVSAPGGRGGNNGFFPLFFPQIFNSAPSGIGTIVVIMVLLSIVFLAMKYEKNEEYDYTYKNMYKKK